MWMLFYYFHFNYKNIWFLLPYADFLSPAFASSIFFSTKYLFYLRLSLTLFYSVAVPPYCSLHSAR